MLSDIREPIVGTQFSRIGLPPIGGEMKDASYSVAEVKARDEPSMALTSATPPKQHHPVSSIKVGYPK